MGGWEKVFSLSHAQLPHAFCVSCIRNCTASSCGYASAAFIMSHYHKLATSDCHDGHKESWGNGQENGQKKGAGTGTLAVSRQRLTRALHL